MSNNLEPIEIKTFLSNLVKDIEGGVDIEQRSIIGEIEIEVTVENITSKEGGLKIYVASGKTGGQNSHIARARFSVRPKQSGREKANIEEALRQNQIEAKKWRDW